MLKKIIGWILLIGIGVGVIVYHRQLVRMFGRNQWAENNLGGTEQMYVLIWALLLIVGFYVMFS